MNFKNKTDEELVSQAGQADSDAEDKIGLLIDSRRKEGRGATAELIRRLKNSIENLNETTSLYSKIIIGLTVVMLFGLTIQIYLARIQTTPVLLEKERNERKAYEICLNDPGGEYQSVSGTIIKCDYALDILQKKFE